MKGNLCNPSTFDIQCMSFHITENDHWKKNKRVLEVTISSIKDSFFDWNFSLEGVQNKIENIIKTEQKIPSMHSLNK